MLLSAITLLSILTTGRCNSVTISQHHCSVAGNGNHLNSYYVCEAHSESVELFVNKGSVGGFIQKSEVGETNVGNINFVNNDGYKYSTILLWARQVDNTTRTRWVVALIVSHPYEAYVYVDCRGQTSTEVAFRNDSCPNPVVNDSRENSNAKINYVLNSTNIIPPYSTFIFTCNVWDQSLFWKINGLLVGQLDSQENSEVVQLQESDSTAVRVVFSDQSVADELSDQNRTLESVLIISGDNISSITCGSSEGSSEGSITYNLFSNLFSNPDSTSNDENSTVTAVINVSSLPTTKDDRNNSPTTDDDPLSTEDFNSTIGTYVFKKLLVQNEDTIAKESVFYIFPFFSFVFQAFHLCTVGTKKMFPFCWGIAGVRA